VNLLKAEVTNFGSYKQLSFDFRDQGLALVYGATGAGKSTLQDIPTWILFGMTAKDGNVDDVRSWTSSEEPTVGRLEIAIRESQINITRIRGSSTQNDLFWIEDGEIYCGKDITETQKLLNQRLAIDPYLYTIAAYYNEFSPTGAFFTAKASDRRQLLENLANLNLPVLLLDRIANVKKETKKEFTKILEKYNREEGRLEQLRRSKSSLKRDAESWSQAQIRALEELQVKHASFEDEKREKIKVAQFKLDKFESNRQATIRKYEKDFQRKVDNFKSEKVCPKCGDIRDKDSNELLEIKEDYNHLVTTQQNQENPHVKEIDILTQQKNPYKITLDSEEIKENPFRLQLIKIEEDIKESESSHNDLKTSIDLMNHKLSSLTQLALITDELRSHLIATTVKTIESQVNQYLESYFDSEIRVMFNIESGDKLEILLWKSGYECSYKQLSKGQRSLLKLCFSIAAMRAASNKIGMQFSTLMFDEALDGLDTTLKLKAFGLFSELSKEHQTILVIDHNEDLQSLFYKKFHVTIEEDTSSIEER
jgi:DNA repair exonuclease SbcCD ATPase subunit